MKHYEPNFKKYLTTYFPEHASHILKSNSQAWFSRVFFPLAFFTVPAVFFACIGFFVYYIKQPRFMLFQNQERFAELIQGIPLKDTLFAIGLLGSIFSLFFFFVGLFVGFSRAHSILFEAEKLELSTKKMWLLEGKNNEDELPSVLKTDNKKVQSVTDKFHEPSF